MSEAHYRPSDLIHARCSICGGGQEIPSANLTGADAQTNINTERIKETLYWCEGILMCGICKQNRINRHQSEVSAERHADEDDFRARAGFRRSIN